MALVNQTPFNTPCGSVDKADTHYLDTESVTDEEFTLSGKIDDIITKHGDVIEKTSEMCDMIRLICKYKKTNC